MKNDIKIYYDLIYLVSCALNNETPELVDIDLQKIKEEALKDSILPTIGMIVPQFADYFLANLYRNVNFDSYKKSYINILTKMI